MFPEVCSGAGICQQDLNHWAGAQGLGCNPWREDLYEHKAGWERPACEKEDLDTDKKGRGVAGAWIASSQLPDDRAEDGVRGITEVGAEAWFHSTHLEFLKTLWARDIWGPENLASGEI